MTRVICVLALLASVSCGDDTKSGGGVDAAVDAPAGSGGSGEIGRAHV